MMSSNDDGLSYTIPMYHLWLSWEGIRHEKRGLQNGIEFSHWIYVNEPESFRYAENIAIPASTSAVTIIGVKIR